ncbi:hypothetical protein [Treponema bryantii]|uniref:hypothetical protein n=1 Tax=Treponema bryantii TaxID=163 RepID=UPI002B30F662|nr:2,3-diaminopropionate biosynthesis protein SbnB [Treponema bryantii]
MLYLGDNELSELNLNFVDSISYIEKGLKLINEKDFAQPLKPYLRFGNPKNRIIAMPSYVGGDINISGIKWIASFPDNIKKNIRRANSVVVLNDTETGVPISIINSPYLSILRTASVSGSIISNYKKNRNLSNLQIGIMGWGPIGKAHFEMLKTILGESVTEYRVFDLRDMSEDQVIKNNKKIKLVSKWEDAFLNSDIVFTCTVSDAPYINKKPKKGALLMNVSLRDYTVDFYQYLDNATIIVDDWDEVCRENTDIENFYKYKNLTKDKTISIDEYILKNEIEKIDTDKLIMFNPMGMAVFDMCIGRYIYDTARAKNIGKDL